MLSQRRPEKPAGKSDMEPDVVSEDGCCERGEAGCKQLALMGSDALRRRIKNRGNSLSHSTTRCDISHTNYDLSKNIDTFSSRPIGLISYGMACEMPYSHKQPEADRTQSLTILCTGDVDAAGEFSIGPSSGLPGARTSMRQRMIGRAAQSTCQCVHEVSKPEAFLRLKKAKAEKGRAK